MFKMTLSGTVMSIPAPQAFADDSLEVCFIVEAPSENGLPVLLTVVARGELGEYCLRALTGGSPVHVEGIPVIGAVIGHDGLPKVGLRVVATALYRIEADYE